MHTQFMSIYLHRKNSKCRPTVLSIASSASQSRNIAIAILHIRTKQPRLTRNILVPDDSRTTSSEIRTRNETVNVELADPHVEETTFIVTKQEEVYI